MKIACTGPKGHVGSVLVDRGIIPLECDITDIDSIRKAIKSVSPDIVINTASKTHTDWISKSKENYLHALSVNVYGTRNLSIACGDIPVVALSTDHIFPGKSFFDFKIGVRTKKGPYKETDNPYPISDYGLTKLGMEYVVESLPNVKVVRTSNLFWKEDPRVMKYFDAAYKNKKVKVPVFQERSFMHIEHFVDRLISYANVYHQMPKVLHLSGSITVDWYTFLQSFCDVTGFALKHKFVKKHFDDKNMTKRPKRVGLDTSLSVKFGFSQYSYLDGLELL